MKCGMVIVIGERNVNLFEYLNLRSEWENIVRSYKFVPKDGTIDNLKNFKENGHKGNRFRQDFDRAMEIANEILRNFRVLS